MDGNIIRVNLIALKMHQKIINEYLFIPAKTSTQIGKDIIGIRTEHL
jgi:hypothetical protein